MMGAGDQIENKTLHAYIDDELAAADVAAVERALAGDAGLAARVAAFRADKQRLADVFGPIAARPLPEAWRRRIAQAAATDRRPLWQRYAAAACVVLALAGGGSSLLVRPADTILAEAARARDGGMRAEQAFAGDTLPDAEVRDRMVAGTIGLKLRAPDLGRFGYRLVAVDLYRSAGFGAAAGLVYRNGQAGVVTIYVRRSSGAVRFDLLRRGRLRVCIWQDDVVGAVMTGEMGAGEMMRIASSAYVALGL